MSGAASLGSDYRLKGTLGQATIPAHKPGVKVELQTKNDHVAEGSETAIMTLQPGSGYQVGSPAQATVTITDN
jgi:hypothetical protein